MKFSGLFFGAAMRSGDAIGTSAPNTYHFCIEISIKESWNKYQRTAMDSSLEILWSLYEE